ncbi:helix-turn-helix domain-containing protein [Micromonospora sp. BRA006-A]|nr:helix-turn-helix domain-containing protein [Micromonospora sp. BRA006-A]
MPVRVRPDDPVTTGPAAATRPRNRRQVIVESAGQVFSERGYHGASMEEIAAAVGISAPALYRHFPNKYALFAECANVMVDNLVGAVDEWPPDAALADVLLALTKVTVAHRASGGLYRWEARYLGRADRHLLRAKFGHVVGRVTEMVRREYPLPGERLRAVAALGVIGSVTMHRTSIAQRRIEDLVLRSAMRVVATDPATAAGTARLVELPAQPVPRTRRAEILAAAVPLFARDGFATVTNAQIAQAVGLAPSAIYRHYPGKVDILVAACLQAAELLAQGWTAASSGLPTRVRRWSRWRRRAWPTASSTTPSTASPRPRWPDFRTTSGVRSSSPSGSIAVWEQQLRAVRPDLDRRQARLLVHAGFGVAVEAGRALRWRDSPGHRDAVTALVTGALTL